MRVYFEMTLLPEALPALLDALVAWQADRPDVGISAEAEAPELTMEEATALLQTMQQRLTLWQRPYDD
jgi:hypothetical protein